MRKFLSFTLVLLPFVAFAQLTETFDGPEVTSIYPWQGNTERFIINANKELQLKGYSGGGEERLYLSSLPLYHNEWRGKARSEYRGTTGNFFRFFLWCERPDLTNPGEAIYVRMGYTKNNIALCHQIGNIRKTVLIEGRALFEDAQEVEFKTTIDGQGICTLYSRCIGEDEFYEEGNAEIPINDAEGYFMIGVKYSSQHRTNKYIDDLYIEQFTLPGEEPEEPEDPVIDFKPEDVEQESATELLLYFDRPVVAEEAELTLTELGEVSELYQSEDEQILKLVWENARTKGKEYTLYYANIFDLSGNESAGEYTFTSRYGPAKEEDPTDPGEKDPDGYIPGCMRINEVMADPKGLTELPETEYVELYNASGQTISLKGWHFVYGETQVALKEMELPYGTYLVLYREGREITIGPGGEEMPLGKFPAQLANTGKQLKLIDPSGTVIDEVTYEQAKAGKSWEWSADGWFLSADQRGGTPGASNSDPSGEPTDPSEPTDEQVEPLEIVFNELLPDPYPDGSEYIELYNRSDRPLSLAGLSLAVRKADGELSTRYKLSEITVPVENEGYIVLSKAEEAVLSFYSTPYPERISKIKMPVLNNNASTLVLFRTTDETVIDEISYSSKWHDPSIRDEKGVALERIDPDGETQDAENWTSAVENVGFGTPGYQNSQYLRQKEKGGTSIGKPAYSHQTTLYSILYSLDQPGYRCRAYIYNLSGQRVAEIANNELLGTRGEILWNGIGYQNERLKPGPYIFYLELYHGKGLVRSYKEVFLVY